MILLLSACSPSSENENDAVISPAEIGTTSYELGQRTYNTLCASCHGSNGEGQFPDAPYEPDVTGRYGAPPHNADGQLWQQDDDTIIKVIREGGMQNPLEYYVMPAMGSMLSDEEIQAVVAYIKTMWTEEQQATQREITLEAETN